MRARYWLVLLAVAALVICILGGCALGIPDADPPTPKAEPCQIFVRIDNGPWRCYERGRVLDDLKKIVPPG